MIPNRTSLRTSSVRALPGACVLAALLLAMASCTSPPTTDSATTPPAAQWEQPVRRHPVCGEALATLRQGALQTISTASGCEPAVEVRADTVFQGASLSKPVFAHAVREPVQPHDDTLLELIVADPLEVDPHRHPTWAPGRGLEPSAEGGRLWQWGSRWPRRHRATRWSR